MLTFIYHILGKLDILRHTHTHTIVWFHADVFSPKTKRGGKCIKAFRNHKSLSPGDNREKEVGGGKREKSALMEGREQIQTKNVTLRETGEGVKCGCVFSL